MRKDPVNPGQKNVKIELRIRFKNHFARRGFLKVLVRAPSNMCITRDQVGTESTIRESFTGHGFPLIVK